MASSTTSTNLITLKPDLTLNTIEDLRALTSGDKFKAEVANTYGKIDLQKTFESLVDAGIMLKVACAAADGQTCRKNIVHVMSDYQDVVHSNLVTCNKFVLNSISALDNHRRAIEFLAILDQGDEDITLEDILEPVLEALADCYGVATEMSKEADAAALLVGKLSNNAADALKQATDDHTSNTKKNNETQQKIDEMTANTQAMEGLLAKYQSNLLELQREKAQAAKDAQIARDRQFALDLTEGIMSHVGDIADAFVKCTNPALTMTGSVVKGITGGGGGDEKKEEGETPTAPTDGVGSGSNSQIDDLQVQVVAQEKLVDTAEKDDGADTADGKKKIQDRQNKLEGLKNALKTAKGMWSEMTKNQQGVAQSIQEKEIMLSKLYYEMAEKEMAKAQEQNRALAILSTMKVDKTELERAIFLLEFTMGIMGEVKTTFLNCKTFWELLAEQCKLLADCKKNIIGDGSKMLESKSKAKIYKTQFQRGVTNGAYRWASVGRVCIDAYDGIVRAKGTVDDAMSNLVISPNELDNAIESLTPRIQSKIELHRPAVENGKKVGMLTEG